MASEMERFYWRAYAMRRKCKANGLPVPEWARIKTRVGQDPLVKPDHDTSYDRKKARIYAKEHNLPIPDWAKLRQVPPREDLTAKPENVRPNDRCRCRKYCLTHNLPIPDWAKLVERPKKIYVSPERASKAPVKPDVITPEAIRRCRAYCRKAHVDYPPWAAMTASKWLESQRTQKEVKAPVRERDIFNASLVLTDVRLALWSGRECFWRRADEEAPCLNDQKLTDAITRRSTDAWAEAMRVCIELNPNFVKTEKDKPDKAKPYDKARANENVRRNNAEKTAAWRKFKTENGIKTPPKTSNRITRVARVEYAR